MARVSSLRIPETKRRALLAAVEDLRADPKVVAAAVIGSISRGDTNPNDIDLLVVVRGETCKTERRMCRGQRVLRPLGGLAKEYTVDFAR
jgi:predicted nucleotidyltransferase